MTFTLLGALFSVRVQVRFAVRGSDSRFSIWIRGVREVEIQVGVPRTGTRNRERRTENREPNLNTNREARTQKCERRATHRPLRSVADMMSSSSIGTISKSENPT